MTYDFEQASELGATSPAGFADNLKLQNQLSSDMLRGSHRIVSIHDLFDDSGVSSPRVEAAQVRSPFLSSMNLSFSA